MSEPVEPKPVIAIDEPPQPRIPVPWWRWVVAALLAPVHYAADARFYGPWLAMAAWLCYALRRRASNPTRANGAATALLSLMVCTIHYFGIISLGLIVCAGTKKRVKTFDPFL